MKNSEVYAIMLNLPLVIKTSTKCVRVCECVCVCVCARARMRAHVLSHV